MNDSSRAEGSVESFDENAGLGTILADDGVTWPFHCVEISDGSRTIEPMSRVWFRLEFRVLRVEAVDVRKM